MLDENSVPSYLVDRFVEECLHHSKLRHPNIVQLIGVHFPDHSLLVPTIVMEYLPMTLAQCLCKYPQLPVHMEGSILLDVASSLDYLHRQSPPIMHRDLTANNVLLTNHMQARGVARGGPEGQLPPFFPGERDVGGALYGGKQVKFSRESTKTCVLYPHIQHVQLVGCIYRDEYIGEM